MAGRDGAAASAGGTSGSIIDLGSYRAEGEIDTTDEAQVNNLREAIAQAFNAGDTDLPANQVRTCPL